MLSQSLAVFLVLALLAALLWLARRKGLATLALRMPGKNNRRVPRQLCVVERIPLTGQHSLHLVNCAGRLILVGVSPAGCHAVVDLGEGAAEAAAATNGMR